MAVMQKLVDTFKVRGINLPWPPSPQDAARLDAYRRNRQLFDGDHINALDDRDELMRYNVYIACNLPKLIATVSTDLLFGENISFEWPKGASDEIKDMVESFWTERNMHQKFAESALDAAHQGDSIWEVYRGDDAGDDYGGVNMAPLPVDMWFPECDEDNRRSVLRHTFGWRRCVVDTRGKDTDFIKMRIHEPGMVRHELWLLENGKLVRQMPPGTDAWERVMGAVDEVVEVPEVGGRFLVRHIPNYRTSRDFFGRSEFKGIHDLVSALNARLTQYDYVLTHHAEPIMQVPPGVKDEHGEIDRNELEFIEANDTDQDVVKYITYDARLDDSRAIIDELTNKILMVTETDRAALGLVEGGGPVSGRAMKFSMARTLAKVARRRRNYDTAIPELLEVAQLMMGIKKPEKPKIMWQDGLPNDRGELIDEVRERLANKTMSRKQAIERLDGLDPEDAESALDEIDSEADADEPPIQMGLARPQITAAPITADEGYDGDST